MTTLAEKVEQHFAGRIKNLVFEGGGVWGIAYEGALGELERLGVLPHVERVAGASAGAITACLLAVGYEAPDIGRTLRETDFRDFKDEDLGYARDTARLLTEYGWYKGDRLKKWIRQRMRQQMRRVSEECGVSDPPLARPTFGELAEWRRELAARGVRLPSLHVVGSNLSAQRRELYDAEETPSLRVEEGIRRSMSIPLFFACARGNARDVIVDGGLTWNYPVNLFDDTRYEPAEERAIEPHYVPEEESSRVFNRETLGFRLDTTKELEANLKDWSNEPLEIDNILRYSWALVAFIRAIANKVHLHKNDWSRTIFIDVGEEIGFTDFGVDEQGKNLLSERGAAGVRQYFEWATSAEGLVTLAAIDEQTARR